MDDRATEMFAQAGQTITRTLTAWAEANQRALRELADLAASTSREGARLYTELQQGALDALRETETGVRAWPATWAQAPSDPLTWYQRSLVGTAEGTQKAFRHLEASTQAMLRSAERWQTSVEAATRGIQEAVGTAVGRLKEAGAAR
ncbi:MAG TPA: hypothetical protein VLI67_05475 [Vicinamibacteria bacterium]|nr:hypothetical protein [Vicinamibacteria bacterium]